MKSIITLLTVACLVVPAAGQTAPTGADQTLAALAVLIQTKELARFGKELRANHERSKFAGFLGTQGRFARLANKETLLRVKAEADRPNYGGNAAAKTHNNLWRAILEGKVQPPQNPSAKTGD